MHKLIVNITGNPVGPIVVGAAAYIKENGGTRRTSTVIALEYVSRNEIRFETVNTKYRLHLAPECASDRTVCANACKQPRLLRGECI